MPATHVRMAPQRRPHAPQLALSSKVLTHAPLHSENPALQTMPQAPLEQTGVAFEAGGQPLSQRPQC
jgi:hypothetical protein